MSGERVIPGDKAKVSIHVAAPPDVAFEVFTAEIDLWWRRGPRFRPGGRRPGALRLEPGVGGRLFESFDDASGTPLLEVGRVRVWEPPSRLVFEWRSTVFVAGESTEVDVSFEPTERGTQVTVEHRGWASIRPNHPARHGLETAAFVRMMGMWWGALMTSLREHVARR